MRAAAPVLVLALAAALPSAASARGPKGVPPEVRSAEESAAQAADLWSRAAARKAAVDKALGEAEALTAGLEELAKTYPTTPDLEATASARQAIIGKIGERVVEVDRLQRGLGALYKEMELRRGGRMLSEAAGLRGVAAAHRQEAARRAGKGRWEAELLDILEFKRYLTATGYRFSALGNRLVAEGAAFEREREVRADLRHMRLAAAAGLSAFALVTVWVVWRRRAPRPATAASVLVLALSAALPAEASAAPARRTGDVQPKTRSAAEVAAGASDLWPRIRTDQAALEKLMAEVEPLLKDVDAFARDYPSSRDFEALASARDRIHGQAVGKMNEAGLLYSGLRAMTKELTVRRTGQMMTEAMGNVHYSRAHKREAVGRAANGPWKNELFEVIEAERSVAAASHRLEGFMFRLAADDEAFAREREARADLRRMRLGLAAGVSALLLAAAWVVWRRRARR